MLQVLRRLWVVFATRGVLAIVLGVFSLIFQSTMNVHAWNQAFAGYAVGDGIIAALLGITSYGKGRWWIVLLRGIIGVLIGLFVFFQPFMPALTLLYVIAAWAFIIGIMEIVAAVQLRRLLPGEWMLFLAGFVALIFAIILIVFPGEGVVSRSSVISIFAIVYGALLVSLGFRLRRIPSGSETTGISAAMRGKR